MNKAAVSILLIGAAASAMAQTPTPPIPPPPPGPPGNVMFQMPTVAVPGAPAGAVQFVTHEFSFNAGPPVAGAPYSADQVTEHIQSLSDGNRIVNTSTTHVFRDSQGRTRSEVALPALPNGEDGPKIVTINDVVAGTVYTLHPGAKIASKMQAPKVALRPGLTARTESLQAMPALPEPPMMAAVGTLNDGPMTLNVGPMMVSTAADLPKPDIKKEDLGTQQIEGVKATGTRVITVIPAGAVGNEQPIQLTSETWYSPDLKVVVKSVHSDPRVGDTSVTMKNLNRAEPDASLFQVPAGYTVNEHGPGTTMFREFKKQP